MYRSGIGYDVHKFVLDRPLILGGVKIPFEMGLSGHSDADVLIHAIMDSILGSFSLGDIGKHFPDTDNNFKNISSITLLRKVSEIIKENNIKIANIDSIIIAQKPKVAKFIDEMRKNISKTLRIDIEKISIKATTEEYLGFTGNLKGIKAVSICMTYK